MTILIAGGGTGGHVFPMIAVGDALRAAAPDEVRVVYVGTARGLEARVVPERGDQLELLPVAPLRGGGALGFARGVAKAFAVLPEARRLVRRLRPRLVLSVGGYAAGPVALAARTASVPVAVLEPNSTIGLTNRLLAPLCARAYTAFPEVERYFRPSIVRRAGVPLRRAFDRAGYDRDAGAVRVLVLGGSQGALALNEVVPRAVALAIAGGASLEITHQTGRERESVVRALYAELGAGARATVVPFIDDVAAALASADLVVGRAGASSLAELCAVGRPAVLVPYPHAADDHQLGNARSLEAAGAAVCVPQPEATAARLAAVIAELAADPQRRARMAEAAAGRGTPRAATTVAEDLLEFARSRGEDD